MGRCRKGFRNNKRIRTVLKFENVLNVHSKNIEQNKKDMFLDFLAIETNKMPDNNYEVKIIFAEFYYKSYHGGHRSVSG